MENPDSPAPQILRLLLAAAALCFRRCLAAPQVIDIEWTDTARGRDLPLKVRVPDGTDKGTAGNLFARVGWFARRWRGLGRTLVAAWLSGHSCAASG